MKCMLIITTLCLLRSVCAQFSLSINFQAPNIVSESNFDVFCVTTLKLPEKLGTSSEGNDLYDTEILVYGQLDFADIFGGGNVSFENIDFSEIEIPPPGTLRIYDGASLSLKQELDDNTTVISLCGREKAEGESFGAYFSDEICNIQCAAHFAEDGSKIFTLLDGDYLRQFNLSTGTEVMEPLYELTFRDDGFFGATDYRDRILAPKLFYNSSDLQPVLVYLESDLYQGTHLFNKLRAVTVTCTSSCAFNVLTKYSDSVQYLSAFVGMQVYFQNTDGTAPQSAILRRDGRILILDLAVISLSSTQGINQYYEEEAGKISVYSAVTPLVFQSRLFSIGTGDILVVRDPETDIISDPANDTSTIVTLAEETIYNGIIAQIGVGYDEDWIRVNLDEDNNYLFELSRPQNDPQAITSPALRIYNSSGYLLDSSEASGDASIVLSLSPKATDEFYVEVATKNNCCQGKYKLRFTSSASLAPIPEGFESLCCYGGDFIGIGAVETADGIRVITRTRDDVFQVWNPDVANDTAPLESILAGTSDAPVASYSVYQDNEGKVRMVTYAPRGENTNAEVNLWYALPQPASAFRTPLLVLVLNFGILFAASFLIFVVLRFRPRIEDSEEARRHYTNELLLHGDNTRKTSAESQIRSHTKFSRTKTIESESNKTHDTRERNHTRNSIFSGKRASVYRYKVEKLSRIQAALAFFGIKYAMHNFESHELKGYNPSYVHFCVPKFGKRKIATNKLLLTLYLIFVGFLFSPRIVPSIFGQIDWSSPTETCELEEEKLQAIRRSVLADLQYENASAAHETNLFNFELMQSMIELDNIISGDTRFQNFPNGSQDGCTEEEERAYSDAKKALTALCPSPNYCKNLFKKFKTNNIDVIISVFDGNIERLVDFEKKCVPPEGTIWKNYLNDYKTIFNSPVDVSVITDLDTLQDIASKYQDLPARNVPQVAERASDAAAEEFRIILGLISLGSDIFTAYAILCIYLVAPLSLYKSHIVTQLKRQFFTINQTLFILILVTAFWTVPYLLRAFDLANLQLYLHNINADVCYTQAGFLSQVGTQIIAACSEMDQLQEDYYTIQYQIKEYNLTANNYKLCDFGGSGYDTIEDLFLAFDEYTALASPDFAGRICDEDYLSESRLKFSAAPGAKPEDAFTLLLSLGVVAQTFAKFIFTNYGLAFVRVFDPLLLHNGLVETTREDTENLPPIESVTELLYYQRFPNYILQVIFILFYCCSMIYLTVLEFERATLTNQILLFALPAGVVILFYLMRYLFFRQEYRLAKKSRQETVDSLVHSESIRY